MFWFEGFFPPPFSRAETGAAPVPRHLNAVNTGQAKCAHGSANGASLSGELGSALLCGRFFFFAVHLLATSLLSATRGGAFCLVETTDSCRVLVSSSGS